MLEEISLRKDLAIELANSAAQQAVRFYNSDLGIQEKSKGDIVTKADKAIEAFLRDEIKRRFPGDAILGEEGGGALGQGLTWVLDPIDGTTNYSRSIGHWCVSIALMMSGQSVLGVVADGSNGDAFVAVRGEGARCRGERLRVSQQKTLSGAYIGIGLTQKAQPKATLLAIETLLDEGASARIFGAGALTLAHVAAGRVDGFFEAYMNIWDCAAGMLLVEEAGGWCRCGFHPANPLDGFALVAAAPGIRGSLVEIAGFPGL